MKVKVFLLSGSIAVQGEVAGSAWLAFSLQGLGAASKWVEGGRLDSLVLIGMPGAGKSTLGQALANLRGRPFVDTDHVIERDQGRSLQSLLDELGFQALRDLEARIIVHAPLPQMAVVATGGSVVYQDQAMQRLKQEGLCVYLAVSLETVKSRVNNLLTRGFSKAPEQSLEDVYQERRLLYQRYADYTIQCDGRSEQSVLAELNRLFPLKE